MFYVAQLYKSIFRERNISPLQEKKKKTLQFIFFLKLSIIINIFD